MEPFEIRERLHKLINELSEEELHALEPQFVKEQEAAERKRLLEKIIAEDARLIKRLGR